MCNCDNLFRDFNSNLKINKSKRDALYASDEFARNAIRDFFKKNHNQYVPIFKRQGSSETKSRIRTKDDFCDQDDGVYFKKNPENVTGTTLQRWVKQAVDGITDASPSHRKKCITLEYKAGYSIDFPVFLYDEETEDHPKLAVKDSEFVEDDPKEFIEEFNKRKDSGGQLIRITRYLKAWCDFKREKMPSGISMTVLAMNNIQFNERDDVAMKFTLIAIEQVLKRDFSCFMPSTPYDDLFMDYEEQRQSNFLDNLASFIEDAKRAVDEEKNQLKSSKLWQSHFGTIYFPSGKDEDEKLMSKASIDSVIGNSKPYIEKR